MGWSVKQDISGGDGVYWSQNLLQSGTAETLKPPFMRRQQPQQQSELLKCPRCGSTNTKFCYYNNYNKSQPRYFCKACKRHWTKGGTLRNVPVGGGRKNKRPKNSNSITITPTTSTSTSIVAVAAADVTTTAAPQHQDDGNFTLTSTFNLDQKIMSNILYQALFHSSPPIIEDTYESIKTIPGNTFICKNGTTDTTVLNESPPQNEITELPFSSSSTFDANSCLIANSYQSLKVYEVYPGNLDSAEESTITTVEIPSSSNMQWLGVETSNSMDHLSNYWNWNDMEELASPDFNISWDTDIKVETNFQDS